MCISYSYSQEPVAVTQGLFKAYGYYVSGVNTCMYVG